MVRRSILIACILGVAVISATAQAPPPPPPGLMIPLPPDLMAPPPEAGPEAFETFLADVIERIDSDGDGSISKEELMAWMARSEGDKESVSEDSRHSEGKPYPPECGPVLTDSELLPQAEGVACDRSESVGSLLFRTLCNMDPYNSNAISLPSGRAADCFGIEAIKGHHIVFEIVEEATGTVVFNTAMGRAAFQTLVLTGGPSGTVYRVNLVSADEADARITIRFIDHPTF